MRVYSHVFLKSFKFYCSFSCYIDMYVFDSFWVDLCLWCEIRGLASLFAFGYLVVSAPFDEETVLYSTEGSWHPGQKSAGQRRKGLVFFSTLKIIFHWSVFLLSICQDPVVWCIPIMFWNWEVCVLQLCSTFSNIGFVIWGSKASCMI